METRFLTGLINGEYSIIHHGSGAGREAGDSIREKAAKDPDETSRDDESDEMLYLLALYDL